MTLAKGPANLGIHGCEAAPEMNESQPGPAPVAADSAFGAIRTAK
jgi:hypothetical protein